MSRPPIVRPVLPGMTGSAALAPSRRAARAACATAAAGAIALTACASLNRSDEPEMRVEPPSANKREVLAGGSSTLAYQPLADRARTIDLGGTVVQLWPHLPAVFDRLALPMGAFDSDQHQISTGAFRARVQLGKASIGEFLDCGLAPLGTPAANTYVVTMTVTSELQAVNDKATLLRSMVTGTARPNTTQSDPVPCLSTGRLEARIATELRKAAGTS